LPDTVGAVAQRFAFADDDNRHRLAIACMHSQHTAAAEHLVIRMGSNAEDTALCICWRHGSAPFLANGERPGACQDKIAVQSRVEKHIEIAQIRDKSLVLLWIDRALIAMKNRIYP